MTSEPTAADDTAAGFASRNITRRRLLQWAGLTGAMAVSSAALPGWETASDAEDLMPAASQHVLTAGVAQIPDTLDPGSTDLIAVEGIVYSMFDPLLWKVPGSTYPGPGLAEKVTVLDNAAGVRADAKERGSVP